MDKKIYRATILHFLHDPLTHGEAAMAFLEDGAMLVADGRVARVAPADVLLRDVSDVPVVDCRPGWIVPGFVDTHIHFPQYDIVASSGDNLLEWLEKHAFVAEMQFADVAHCQRMATLFLDELLRNGTTSALVFGTVHPQSAEAFLAEANARHLRMAAGKVLMDCNAPPPLLDTPESAYNDSRALIEKWHKKGRLTYAVTPRFAYTSSALQLKKAAALLGQYPDVLLHTHLSENAAEIEGVLQVHAPADNYVEVYHRHGLVTERSVFAHGIHLQEEEWAVLAAQRSAIAFCPCSNFVLGSGLFDAKTAGRHGVTVSLGSDVGGGTSFSLFRVMDEAFKCARLRGDYLSPSRLWYLATLGGAEALHFDGAVGNFINGKEADFLLLNPENIPIVQHRFATAKSVEEKLLLMAMLGDDRLIEEVFIMGAPSKPSA